MYHLKELFKDVDTRLQEKKLISFKRQGQVSMVVVTSSQVKSIFI